MISLFDVYMSLTWRIYIFLNLMETTVLRACSKSFVIVLAVDTILGEVKCAIDVFHDKTAHSENLSSRTV